MNNVLTEAERRAYKRGKRAYVDHYRRVDAGEITENPLPDVPADEKHPKAWVLGWNDPWTL